MRRTLSIAALLLGLTLAVHAQADHFLTNQPVGDRPALPYPYVRDVDVVWSTTLWKYISTAELFNQFFYFPDDDAHTYGKKSLAYVLWDAVVANEIPIYEDDEMLIEIDNELFVRNYTRADTIQLEIGYDEDDEEHYETIIQPRFFEGSEIYNYALKEVWFIGKHDTRQDSRRIALAPLKESVIRLGNGVELNQGIRPLFWVPMQHPAVRALLARYTAYIDPDNMVGQPSWDWVFLNQYYSAFVTRESNIYNRAISKYLTGEDALLEAERIEAKVFDLENDMWEY
jgi:gliding motility associated protien GldN